MNRLVGVVSELECLLLVVNEPVDWLVLHYVHTACCCVQLMCDFSLNILDIKVSGIYLFEIKFRNI